MHMNIDIFKGFLGNIQVIGDRTDVRIGRLYRFFHDLPQMAGQGQVAFGFNYKINPDATRVIKGIFARRVGSGRGSGSDSEVSNSLSITCRTMSAISSIDMSRLSGIGFPSVSCSIIPAS